jgi:Transposase DDE domain
MPDDRVPPGHQDIAARLATPTGHDLYTRRSAIVEPGFAQLFQRFGRHLHYRGANSVDTELKLLGTVHNLNKLLRHETKTGRRHSTLVNRQLKDAGNGP